jgi:hypothetical protein
MGRNSVRLALLIVSLIGATALFVASPASAASGSQYVASNPGVYDRTTSEYSYRWAWDEWVNRSYIAYLFKSSGDLYAGPWRYDNGGDGAYNPPGANIFYWKEYNNSGGLVQFTVSYCC